MLQGLAANYLSFALEAPIRFLATPFYLSRLGGDLLGLNAFIHETLSYFRLMEFGTGPAVAAIVAKELQPGSSEEEKDSVRRKARAAGQLQQAISAVVLLLSVCLALVLDRIAYGIPSGALFMARVCLVGFGLELALRLSSGVYSGLLVGLQRIGENTVYTSVSKTLSALLGVLLVALGWSLYGLATAAVLSGLFLFVQLRLRSRRSPIRLDLLRGPIEWSALREVMVISGWGLVASAGGLLSNQSARVILGIVPSLGMASVNRFSLLVTAPALLSSQLNYVSMLVRPGLTQVVHGGDVEKSKAISRTLVRGVGMMSALTFAIVFYLNGGFVVRWVGAEYFAGERANALAAVLAAGGVWRFGFTVLLEARFLFRRRGAVFAASGLFTVLLSAAMAPKWGIEGVLVGAVAGELLVGLPLAASPILVWLSSGNGLLRTSVALTWLPLLSIVGCLSLERWGIGVPGSWLGLIVGGIVIVLVGCALSLAWMADDLRRFLFGSQKVPNSGRE